MHGAVLPSESLRHTTVDTSVNVLELMHILFGWPAWAQGSNDIFSEATVRTVDLADGPLNREPMIRSRLNRSHLPRSDFSKAAEI